MVNVAFMIGAILGAGALVAYVAEALDRQDARRLRAIERRRKCRRYATGCPEGVSKEDVDAAVIGYVGSKIERSLRARGIREAVEEIGRRFAEVAVDLAKVNEQTVEEAVATMKGA